MSPPADPFAALGDPHRRAIVEIISRGERSVQAIADRLPISRPAVSRHLRVLRAAGLVTVRPEGTRNLYRLDDAGPAAIRSYMVKVWGEAVPRFKLYVENTTSGR